MTRDNEQLKRKPYQLADGRYRVKATVRTVDGKQQQRAFYGATLAEAKRKRSDWQRDEAARHVEPSRLTVAQYLEEWYAATEPGLKESTRYHYRYLIDHYITPEIGAEALQKLTARRLDAFLAWCSRREDGTLRLTTASRVRGLLLDALERAVRLGHLARNPVRLVEPVKRERRELDYWQEGDLRRFLAANRGSRFFELYVVAVGTGLRRGELLGLQWGDVGAKSLTVQRSNTVAGPKRVIGNTKTRAGRRRVPFNATVAAAFQAVADRTGREKGSCVFANHDGTPFHPSGLYHYWSRDVGKAGVPYMNFHGLRHTYASLAIASGMDVRRLAGILGHARPSITLDTYSHFFEAHMEGAALDISGLLEGEQGSKQGSTTRLVTIGTVDDTN